MAGPLHRQWMYRRRNPDGRGLRDEWLEGVKMFDEYARNQEEYRINGVYRCPCAKCKNMQYLTPDVVKSHLYRKGFVRNYWYWTSHGEEDTSDAGGTSSSHSMHYDYDHNDHNHMENMLQAAFQANEMNTSSCQYTNPEAFYTMLESAQRPLHEGCNISELEASVRLLSIKSENNMSQRCFNQMVDLMRDMCPSESRIPKNYHQQLRKVRDLGLDVQEIDCCPNGCMLYYKEDNCLSACKFCGHARYVPKQSNERGQNDVSFSKMYYLPLVPRLQRLYSSQRTSAHMRWHHEHRQEAGVLRHPSDGLAWKHFDKKYPNFAAEPRNVRLGLCADGFTPFSVSGRSYSVWPIVVTPYNLPPDMCMTTPYLFLSCMVPGPTNPKNRIDVYLQPLIDELKMLWDVGVDTFDASCGTTFRLHAALMWTINDFPAYGMLSGWSTHGQLACPVCMHQNCAFQLQHGRKPCWFDCHRRFLPRNHCFRGNKDAFRKGKSVHTGPPQRIPGEVLFERVSTLPKVTESINFQIPGFEENEHNWTKQSILWELPYWKHQLLRHNLDVMHIEKNVSENIINTVMDVPGKTKDDIKARMDMQVLCNRPELSLTTSGSTGRLCKPKAKFTLSLPQKRAVCEWLREVHVPDGYCSNVKNWVDPSHTKFQNMKSHDHHVFLENLLPVAFAALPEDVLGPLVELSEFFRNLCSSELHVSMLEEMHKNIAIILCKLETVFPPGFWNVMEHLPIHLAEEALLGGPVQYRWMYPFERFFGWLKPTAKNKAHVEACMVNAYLAFETKHFAGYYFQASLSRPTAGRNEGKEQYESHMPTLSVFNFKGTPFGKRGRRYLTEAEYHVARLHILLNCAEVQPYLDWFRHQFRSHNPNASDIDVDLFIEANFAQWFECNVNSYRVFNDERQTFLVNLSHGPIIVVECFSGYKVNGYRFHTKARNEGKTTYNCGVCVKGVGEGAVSGDYYGVLHEVIRVEFTGEPIKKCVLFNCEWFDPDVPRGVRYPKLTLYPEVNHTRRYRKFDPFIFADTATQVVYLKYPGGISGKTNWWVAVPNKPRGAPKDKDNIEVAYQQLGMTTLTAVDNVIPTILVDEAVQADEVDGNGEDADGDQNTNDERDDEATDADDDDDDNENIALQSAADDDDSGSHSD